MRAVQLGTDGIRLTQVADPVPGPGQVVLDVLAAGLCHSDLTLAGRDPAAHPFSLPLTLGHEIAGVVSSVGDEVTGVAPGDAVAVYGPWGCGECRTCLSGAENHCASARRRGILPPGLGAPGGLAERLLVDDPRHLVALDGLDPLQAAPLTDAGLTAFHALRPSLDSLDSSTTTVLIGVGGLGHLALQMLLALSSTRVVVLDLSERARALAVRLGAHTVIRDLADLSRQTGDGADLVLDFVAGDETLAAAAGALRPGGELVVVGVGSGRLPVGLGAIPLGATVRTSYWGTLPELGELFSLARSGKLSVTVETCDLEEVPAAYRRLAGGGVTGRIVARPIMPSNPDTKEPGR